METYEVLHKENDPVVMPNILCSTSRNYLKLEIKDSKHGLRKYLSVLEYYIFEIS